MVTRARRQGGVHSAEESRLDALGLWLGTVVLIISETERGIVLMPALCRVNIVGDRKWSDNSVTRRKKQSNTTEVNLRGVFCFLPPSGVHYSSATTTGDPETRQTKPPILTCIGVSKKFQGASGRVGVGSVKSPKEAALDEEPWKGSLLLPRGRE